MQGRSLVSAIGGIKRQALKSNAALHRSLALHTSARALLPSSEATQTLEGFHSRYPVSSSTPATHYFQTIDSNQVHLLRTTLANMIPLAEGEEKLLSSGKVAQHGIPEKTALIPAEHLAFFTPRVGQDMLGKDGADKSFNPPGSVFSRRMWAGGEMTFEKENVLRIGDQAWEKTFVEQASVKELSGGRGEMILVWVTKEIGNQHGLCLTDRRSWVLQPGLQQGDKQQAAAAAAAIPPLHQSSEDDTPSSIVTSTRLVQNPSNLFRYSALTFNAHAIHLSTPWAQTVEGHRDIVVHGPLNLTLLLRKWGKEIGKWSIDEQGQYVIGQGGKQIHKVKYRATKPIHAHHPYWIGFPANEQQQQDGESESTKVIAVKEDGQVAMEANITSW